MIGWPAAAVHWFVPMPAIASMSLVIARDGPTASGNGTVALGDRYLDSGALYRRVVL